MNVNIKFNNYNIFQYQMIYYICIYLHIFIHKSMKPSELQDPAGYRLEDQKSDRPQQSHCGTLHWKCHEMSMNHGSMSNSQFEMI